MIFPRFNAMSSLSLPRRRNIHSIYYFQSFILNTEHVEVCTSVDYKISAEEEGRSREEMDASRNATIRQGACRRRKLFWALFRKARTEEVVK